MTCLERLVICLLNSFPSSSLPLPAQKFSSFFFKAIELFCQKTSHVKVQYVKSSSIVEALGVGCDSLANSTLHPMVSQGISAETLWLRRPCISTRLTPVSEPVPSPGLPGLTTEKSLGMRASSQSPRPPWVSRAGSGSRVSF